MQWMEICQLTDKNLLGLEGMSHAAPREKARAIVRNDRGEIALMYEQATNLHALPGGGLEPGEDAHAALCREVTEETGCSCDRIVPLGIVSENRAHADTTHISYFFIVDTKTQSPTSQLTEEEIALGTVLKWCSVEEAIRLIGSNTANTPQKRFLQARDLAALNAYVQFTQARQ